MIIKQKLSDVAKDFGLTVKTVGALYGDQASKKPGSELTEPELNLLYDILTKENGVDSLADYFSEVRVATANRLEAERAADVRAGKIKSKSPEKAQKVDEVAVKDKPANATVTPELERKKSIKPQHPQAVAPIEAQKKPLESKVEMPVEEAQGAKQQKNKKLHQAKPKMEKLVPTGREPIIEVIGKSAATVTIDTRTVDVNLEKFNDRYDDMAGKSNVSTKRKHDNTQQGKQKFNKNRQQNRQGIHGTKKRETEAERLQRIQLEKARRAQLKISIPDEISVSDLATRLKVTASEVIKRLMGLGVMASLSEVIDFDTAHIVAEELGAKVTHEVTLTIEDRLFTEQDDTELDTEPRCPIVVVMGHVDHGKTSILDAIRKTAVTEGEAGGITQHIGAYQVEHGDSKITFLDTPGHEAFTSMRARGASVTDIAILVVAADDGIMPQTVEAINHAKAAGVSIIVAVNKIDKPEANPARVRQELTEHEIVPEEWGGDVICCDVSAKTGEGLDNLLETITLVADMKELKANPARRAKGTVVEAKLDKGQGPVATILVQNGTLNRGDIIIAGTAVGRVRVMVDAEGNRMDTAGPSMPVEITGLTDVPAAGDIFEAVEDERLARELAEQRSHNQRQEQWKSIQKVTLDNLFTHIASGEMKELPIIVKADVQGSAEAIRQSLEKLSNEEVRVRVIHTGVGAISKSDVMLANASGGIIIGFNVRPDPVAKAEAEEDDVEIRTYRVIYDAIEDVKDAMKGMLDPKFREQVLGRIEVRQVYRISSAGTIAGCYVLDGKVIRSAKIRLVRDGVVICEDEIDSLRRFKEDVKEVATGYECGIGLERYSDIKEGDIFEAFVLEEYRDE